MHVCIQFARAGLGPVWPAARESQLTTAQLAPVLSAHGRPPQPGLAGTTVRVHTNRTSASGASWMYMYMYMYICACARARARRLLQPTRTPTAMEQQANGPTCAQGLEVPTWNSSRQPQGIFKAHLSGPPPAPTVGNSPT